MRTKWLAVVGAEVAIGVVLAVQLLRPATRPAPTGGLDVARNGAPAAAAAASTPAPRAPGAAATAADPGSAREPAAVPARAAADAVGVVLHGSVRWTDGGAVAHPVVRAHTAGAADGAGAERQAWSQADGRYTLTGLGAGTWQLDASADGAVPATTTVVVTGDALQTADLVLDRRYAVRVVVHTPDGAAFPTPEAWRTIGVLRAAGRREPFPARVGTSEQLAATAGDAVWQLDRDARDGAIGTLLLAAPPPAHVALLVRHVVVAQHALVADQRDVVFVLEPNAVTALLGRATVRVLDAATGEPLKGRVTLSNAAGPGGQPLDAQGRATFEHLLPGPMRCRIVAAQRENHEALWHLAPGETLDLGDVRLAPALPLRGRVVDETGAPANASLVWTDLKWLRSAAPFTATRTSRCEADGTFSLWASGPGDVAVLARTRDGRVAAGVFTNPPPSPIELRLARAGRLVVTRPAEPPETWTLTLLEGAATGGARRAFDAIALEPAAGPQTLLLPPGRHAFTVHDEQGRLVRSGDVDIGAATATLELR